MTNPGVEGSERFPPRTTVVVVTSAGGNMAQFSPCSSTSRGGGALRMGEGQTAELGDILSTLSAGLNISFIIFLGLFGFSRKLPEGLLEGEGSMLPLSGTLKRGLSGKEGGEVGDFRSGWTQKRWFGWGFLAWVAGWRDGERGRSPMTALRLVDMLWVRPDGSMTTLARSDPM